MMGGRFLMATTLLCVGCAGLPPKQQPVQLPSAAPLDDLTAAGGDWPAQQWWKRYQDPTLDQLIELAVASSPNLPRTCTPIGRPSSFHQSGTDIAGLPVRLATMPA